MALTIYGIAFSRVFRSLRVANETLEVARPARG